jgi:protein-S-isoprenylcysteine O-methyltransferase Ste14
MMNKQAEFLKAILILPGTVLIFIPGVLLYLERPVYLFGGLVFPEAFIPLALAAVLIGGGFLLALKTVTLFITVGEGTPAPWAPPQRFVMRGPYAHVRNPMILGVLSMLLGEAVLFASLAILTWWALFWVVNTFYFMLFEERDLEQRFGHQYLEYKKHVRRWLPRLKPWQPQ